MVTIGLIAAMKQERDALLHLVKGVTRIRIGGSVVHRFEVASQDCILVTSGMGLKRAADAAQLLVEYFPPQAIITFGIAGAVEPGLEIGDVVLSDSVCLLEKGVLSPFVPLASWPDASRQAMTGVLSKTGARLFTGCAVSTMGSQLVQDEGKQMLHPILEMETFGIANAAAGSGIPVFSLRAISDGPSAPLPIDLGRMMDENANLKVGSLLGEVLRHPGILFKSRPILANTAAAAENAARALLEGLECLSPDPLP